MSGAVVFENVSKFYGEVLGVNRVTLTIPPGVTSLVGPNGSGKTTLMNLMTGLLRPTAGTIGVLGVSPQDPEALFRVAGYATQFDSFPHGSTGRSLVRAILQIHGFGPDEVARRTEQALERVGMREEGDKKLAGCSKGMRQRIKLASAMAHDPQVLVLDEPLNGLDPLARAELIALMEALGREGRHVLVSSHILHEVDRISDRVIVLNGGYVAGEGAIAGVRGEITSRPLQVLIRCTDPARLAGRVLAQDTVVQVRIHDDRKGLLVHTRDADRFYLLLNRIVVEERFEIEQIAPADEDADAVYRYLVEDETETEVTA